MSDQQPMRVLRLDQILDPTQLADVESLIVQIRAGRVKLDTLRFYLTTQEESLLSKDIDASYLFYAVSYAAGLF